jgi:hypothetical protein
MTLSYGRPESDGRRRWKGVVSKIKKKDLMLG